MNPAHANMCPVLGEEACCSVRWQAAFSESESKVSGPQPYLFHKLITHKLIFTVHESAVDRFP